MGLDTEVSRTLHLNSEKWNGAAPRGLVAFKPAPNPALNKPPEGDSNQKRLLKILLKPSARAHPQSHTQGNGCRRVSVAVSERVSLASQHSTSSLISSQDLGKRACP